MRLTSFIRRRRSSRVLAAGLMILCATAPGSKPRAAAAAYSLQAEIDAASPGDTVRVEPGDYSRVVQVAKAITIRPLGEPGSVRLAGIEASLATLEDIVFDGAIAAGMAASAVAGDGVTFTRCFFTRLIRGLKVEPGAAGVTLRDCDFADVIEVMVIGPGLESLLLDRVTATGFAFGVTLDDTLVCPPGSVRVPAVRCPDGACGEIRATDSRFEGGEIQFDLSGSIRFVARRCTLAGAASSVRARGGRIELEDCAITGVAQSGTGLTLDSVSGHLLRCEVMLWGTALDVGDGDCPAYSDLSVGGTLASANDFDQTRVGLRLRQPEPLAAEANFWGSVDCAAVLAAIQGQTVQTITDVYHGVLYFCPTAVERASWGSIKTRYAEPVERSGR